MNLEIPIKHIITDQRRAGGGWQGLLAATPRVFGCAGLSCLNQAPGAGWGSGVVTGAPPLPGKVKSDPWGCYPPGCDVYQPCPQGW